MKNKDKIEKNDEVISNILREYEFFNIKKAGKNE